MKQRTQILPGWAEKPAGICTECWTRFPHEKVCGFPCRFRHTPEKIEEAHYRTFWSLQAACV